MDNKIAYTSTPEWKWGRWAEEEVVTFFRSLGRFVIPTKDIERGGAPLLLGKLKNYPLPDLQIAGEGQVQWMEVKFKDSPTKYQKKNSWRHGIDLPKWRCYQQVEKETGLQSNICIYEQKPEPDAKSSPCILLATFDNLRDYAIVEPGRDGMMAYWDVDRTPFIRIPMTPSGHRAEPQHSTQRRVHKWERSSREGVLPRQAELEKRAAQPNLFGTPMERAEQKRAVRAENRLANQERGGFVWYPPKREG